MAEALAKEKKICHGHGALATQMINWAGKTIAAFEADPMMELDVKGLRQLKLSLDEKLTQLQKG